MDVLKKAKNATEKLTKEVTNSAIGAADVEAIAESIIQATQKKDRINAILEKKGSNYRVGEIDLAMGMPPSISFSINLISEDK